MELEMRDGTQYFINMKTKREMIISTNHSSCVCLRELRCTPVLVLANKIDLTPHLSEHDLIKGEAYSTGFEKNVYLCDGAQAYPCLYI